MAHPTHKVKDWWQINVFTDDKKSTCLFFDDVWHIAKDWRAKRPIMLGKLSMNRGESIAAHLFLPSFNVKMEGVAVTSCILATSCAQWWMAPISHCALELKKRAITFNGKTWSLTRHTVVYKCILVIYDPRDRNLVLPNHIKLNRTKASQASLLLFRISSSLLRGTKMEVRNIT